MLACLCRCLSFSVENDCSDSNELSNVKLLKELEGFLRGLAGVGVIRRDGVEPFLENQNIIKCTVDKCKMKSFHLPTNLAEVFCEPTGGKSSSKLNLTGVDVTCTTLFLSFPSDEFPEW